MDLNNQNRYQQQQLQNHVSTKDLRQPASVRDLRENKHTVHQILNGQASSNASQQKSGVSGGMGGMNPKEQ